MQDGKHWIILQIIDEKAQDSGESENTIAKYCPDLTKANFEKGLK